MSVAETEIMEELLPVLQERYGGDKLPPIVRTTNFVDDLGADSLDLVELIMEIEDKFGIKIPDEDAQRLKTVGDALDYIMERKSGE